MKKKTGNNTISEWEELLNELYIGFNRDRNMAIVTIAFVDSLIEKKFRKILDKGNKKVQNSLFENNGAFSTFSSKLNCLYCVGVLLPQVYQDLNILRKIRNEFAHGSPSLQFDTQKIKNRIEQLNSYKFLVKNKSEFKLKSIDILDTSTKYRISATITIMWLFKDLDNLESINVDKRDNKNLVPWKSLTDKKKIADIKGNEYILQLLKVKELQDIMKIKD